MHTQHVTCLDLSLSLSLSLFCVQKGGESAAVAVKTCKLDDEYETAEKFLEEARKSPLCLSVDVHATL